MQRENLCDFPVFTGYDRDGGFAEYAAADERFCFALPGRYDDCHSAPLLCAGLIGFRAWRLAGEAAPHRLGLYGFGAAAHIVCQIAVSQQQQVHAFTQPGDAAGQRFARSLGAAWAGGSDEMPPAPLDAALIFAPVGALVPAALAATRKGGTVVCAGIHMSPIPSFEYRLLWGERVLKSVANLTREDGDAFFALIDEHPVQTHVQAPSRCRMPTRPCRPCATAGSTGRRCWFPERKDGWHWRMRHLPFDPDQALATHFQHHQSACEISDGARAESLY